ncbi:MAG: VOC family protein [Candidatus Binatia bacterium]
MSSEDRQKALDPKRGRLAPTKLAHVVRRTSRFAEMIRWHEVVFGAYPVYKDDTIAFLTYDDEHHRFAIANIPGLPDQPELAAGTDHVAFTHDSLGDLLYTYERLKGEGIVPYWCINHGMTTSMYYKDPDGNRVEFQADNFPSVEEGNAWIRNSDFAANPIGVIFEPEDLLARFKAGEPLEKLVIRPALPEGKSPFDMLRL